MKKFLEFIVYTISLPATMCAYALAFAFIAFLDYCHWVVDTIKDVYNGSDPESEIDIIDRAFFDKD